MAKNLDQTIARVLGVGGAIFLVLVTVLGLGVFGIELLRGVAQAASEGGESSAAPLVAATPPRVVATQDESQPLAANPVVSAAQPPAELLAVGKNVYMQCAACHGPQGKSLVPTMAPNLAGSEWVTGSSERLAVILLNGIKPEGRYAGAMIAWKALLTDEQIAGVLTYIRANFGNQAPAITAAMMAEARAKYAGINQPMPRSEIEVIAGELTGE